MAYVPKILSVSIGNHTKLMQYIYYTALTALRTILSIFDNYEHMHKCIATGICTTTMITIFAEFIQCMYIYIDMNKPLLLL